MSLSGRWILFAPLNCSIIPVDVLYIRFHCCFPNTGLTLFSSQMFSCDFITETEATRALPVYIPGNTLATGSQQQPNKTVLPQNNRTAVQREMGEINLESNFITFCTIAPLLRGKRCSRFLEQNFSATQGLCFFHEESRPQFHSSGVPNIGRHLRRLNVTIFRTRILTFHPVLLRRWECLCNYFQVMRAGMNI